jgi:aldehyde:ferredoxin oxidoreductase
MMGTQITVEDMLNQSARVYNFQRIFNIRMGKGLRVHDKAPYRSMGPVGEEEYLSREERYDRQIKDEMSLDPTKMTLEERRAAHRSWRCGRYEQLTDAVYKRRGWTPNGVPTLERIKELGIDFPEVLEVVEPFFK